MTVQKLLSPMRRAITDYKMIEDGDRIAVGLSGGKDSGVLLRLLKAYQRFSPERFELVAITIDMGAGADYSPLKGFCEELNVPFILEKTDMYQIIFKERKEKNPCSLCSKMRRGALNSLLLTEGCNKLALGHHADDAAETMLLSLIFEGRFSTFKPKSFMSRTGVTLIRPLIYTDEKDVAACARDNGVPVVHNPCPSNHETNREYMKNLIRSLNKDFAVAGDNIKKAIFNPDRNNLWDDLEK